VDEGIGTNGLGFMRHKDINIQDAKKKKRAGACGWLRLPICACMLIFAVAAGCGEAPVSRPEEEVVVERALQAALKGERNDFVTLVAPSFVADMRTEMPDSGDDILGGVLVAGFLEDIPFSAVVDATFNIDSSGDEASVYVWGVFLDESGTEMVIDEAAAVRIPLVREDGSWYVDLLDL